MAKLNQDRRWCLMWWKDGGWSIGRPSMNGIKKWRRHIEMLVKAELLEADECGCYRITDAGRAALLEKGK